MEPCLMDSYSSEAKEMLKKAKDDNNQPLIRRLESGYILLPTKNVDPQLFTDFAKQRGDIVKAGNSNDGTTTGALHKHHCDK